MNPSWRIKSFQRRMQQEGLAVVAGEITSLRDHEIIRLQLHDRLERGEAAEIETEIDDDAVLSSIERASLEREAKRFAARQGYVVDWDSVGQLDDATLVNGIAQVAPFDAAAKQALLEATPIDARAELVVQLMQFFGRYDSDDGRATLQ